MKGQIMDKLFSGQELTGEEAAFVGRNLTDNAYKGLTFNHDDCDTMAACNVTVKDFENFNVYLQDHIGAKMDEIKGMSSMIAKYEEAALASPKHLRMLMMNYVKLNAQAQHPLLGLLGLLSGGGPKGDK